RLVRLGFADPARAEKMFADPVLKPVAERDSDGLLAALGDSPDPDLALLGSVRLLEAAAQQGDPQVRIGLEEVLTAGETRARLLAVLGASRALADHLARHPQNWVVVGEQDDPLQAEPESLRS